MNIREASDLHLEFKQYNLPTLATDKETVLILAGDIGLLTKAYTYELFIEEHSDRFKHIIWLYGNHEFYKGNWPDSHKYGVEACKDLPNVTCGYQFVKVIDDVAFVCDILWSDYNKYDPYTLMQAQMKMNDHYLIRTGPEVEPWRRKFLPDDAFQHHLKAKTFIKENVLKFKEEGKKIIVVTHQAPSFLSIGEQYKGDILNGAYASDMYEMIEELQPLYWFHGHMHDNFEYKIGETVVICNPRGYNGENRNFNPTLLLEI